MSSGALQKDDCRPRKIENHAGWSEAQSLEGHAVPPEVIRCAATTVSGAHEVTAAGRRQLGQRKDAPPRPQSNVRLGALAPLGRPRATDVRAGARADAGVSLALMARSRPGVPPTGLRFVGDGQRRAWATRASMGGPHDLSLAPWPCTGATAEAMAAWSSEGVARGKRGALVRVLRTPARGHAGLTAAGDAFERTCGAQGRHEGWTERVMVVRSPVHAHPGGGRGPTSAPCGARPGGPHASPRSGQAPEHRGSDARGGDGPRAQNPSRGGTAQRGLGKAGGAASPLSGPGARLGDPSTAGPRGHPLPHSPHGPAGRQPRRSPPTVRLAGCCHPGSATTALLGGGGGGLAQCLPRGPGLQPPHELPP
jgi:hypothetical protein